MKFGAPPFPLNCLSPLSLREFNLFTKPCNAGSNRNASRLDRSVFVEC